MLKWILNIALFVLACVPLHGQDTVMHKIDSLPEGIHILNNVTRNGETMPEVELEEITITKKMGARARFQWWRYRRLVSNVKKVYPYALIVREKFSEINDTLQHIEGEKARKQFMKDYETNLFGQYEDDIKHMTIFRPRVG